MIAALRGTVLYRVVDHAVIEVAGVGYRVAMSANGLASVGSVGDSAFVHTHLVVRENELLLVGFADEAERDTFLALIEVSGVGPKVALAILSALSSDTLALAVASDDTALVCTAPGVGKKTAQRIIIELKDKLSPRILGAAASGAVPGAAAGVAAVPDTVQEARTALIGMGFTPAECSTALADAASGDTVEQLLARALKSLGSGGH